jgi:hypothetical protein
MNYQSLRFARSFAAEYVFPFSYFACFAVENSEPDRRHFLTTPESFQGADGTG